MGLLTDPTAGQGKLTKFLLKYHSKLCVLLYVAGVVSFCCLVHPQFNADTYFSENALLPGLVHSEFRDENSARSYYYELLEEMKNYNDELPYPWLLAKFQQLGLDTYTHNFSLNYPLGTKQKFVGKNVYAILRAARASSVESLILSVPYRTPTSLHLTTAPSVAVMLAFAKFANKEKYWAKDIIFLVTEHEQLGVQAWLEAYHGVNCGKSGVLESGDLVGRAGAIQAAINLEFHSSEIGHVDVKIEGLNGQLPNLDLFNLVNRICVKEVTNHTFKNYYQRNFRDPMKNYMYHFKTLLAMIATQATGIPNGNHGLFHRFGIEALTMEGFAKAAKDTVGAGFLIQGRILEGIFRSLNNLLERFHQSYFFYLLPAPNKFISIGLYMPSACLMAGSLFIKACALWYQLLEDDDNESEKKETETKQKPEPSKPTKEIKRSRNEWQKLFKKEIESDDRIEIKGVSFLKIVGLFIFCHVLGVVVMYSPPWFTKIGASFGYGSDTSVFYGLGLVSAVLLAMPIAARCISTDEGVKILNIFCLLELGTALICVAMNNFSLALFCATVSVPMALVVGQTSCRIRLYVQRVFWLLVHPLSLLTVTVLIYTLVVFRRDPLKENLFRGIAASQQALVFAVVDSMIYGNWLFSVITSIFLPIWLCFWCVAFAARTEEKVKISKEKKDN